MNWRVNEQATKDFIHEHAQDYWLNLGTVTTWNLQTTWDYIQILCKREWSRSALQRAGTEWERMWISSFTSQKQEHWLEMTVTWKVQFHVQEKRGKRKQTIFSPTYVVHATEQITKRAKRCNQHIFTRGVKRFTGLCRAKSQSKQQQAESERNKNKNLSEDLALNRLSWLKSKM